MGIIHGHPQMGRHPQMGIIQFHLQTGCKQVHPQMGRHPQTGIIQGHPQIGSIWFHPLTGCNHPKTGRGSIRYHPRTGCNYPKTGRQNRQNIKGQFSPNVNRQNHPITSREPSKRDVRRKDPILGCEKTSGRIPTDSCRLTYSLQAIRGHPLQQR